MITVYIKVKFRFLRFDIGTFEKSVPLELPIPIQFPPFEKVLVDERGVYLKVSA